MHWAYFFLHRGRREPQPRDATISDERLLCGVEFLALNFRNGSANLMRISTMACEGKTMASGVHRDRRFRFCPYWEDPLRTMGVMVAGMADYVDTGNQVIPRRSH
jgi:hypothetical protein